MALTRRRNDSLATALTTSLQTILTFNAGLADAGGILLHIKLVNRSASDRTITAHVIESGGSAANGNVCGVVTVPANDEVVIRGPFFCNSSAFVQAKMDGGSSGDVNAWPVAIEVS